MKRILLSGLFVVSFVMAGEKSARADILLTPFLGVTFGGDAVGQALNYGASIGFMGGGILGAELQADFTPKFFGGSSHSLSDDNVANVMINLIAGAPLGSPGVRPYVSGGAGIIRSRATGFNNVFDLNQNSFGVNAGVGLIMFFSHNAGVRADVRYFKGLQDADAGENISLDFGRIQFARATVGVTFRF